MEPAIYKLKTEEDRLSKLPEIVTDIVLSKLPLRDAVRTSILSSKWRYKWCKLSYLMFSDLSELVSSEDQTTVRNKVVDIVHHVLLLHDGPIKGFWFSDFDLNPAGDGGDGGDGAIDGWILFLSRHSLNEFVFYMWNGDNFKLPSSLFLFQNLVHLELYNCVLKPPVTFNGFKALKILDLSFVAMEQNEFDSLISSCPLLERLTVGRLNGITNLEIHAPNLLFLYIASDFETVNLKDTCNLSIASVFMYEYPSTSGNLIKFFADLPRIKRLQTFGFFMTYLSAVKVPFELPTPCLELRFLYITIDISEIKEILAVLCLLRSSPNLEVFEILTNLNDKPDLQVDKKDDYLFNHLKIVKLSGICGFQQERDLVKYILAKSHVLEKMIINTAHGGLGEYLIEFLKELLLFGRISFKAQVMVNDDGIDSPEPNFD